MAQTKRSPMRWLAALSAATLLLAACGTEGEPADAPPPEDDAAEAEPDDEATEDDAPEATSGNFAGETIDFVVPFSPGGGYDVYARVIAEELGPLLDAEVVVRNEAGAGGLLATNRVFGAGDDNTIIIPNMVGILGLELAGGEGAEYTATEFSWIGQVSSEPSLINASADGRIQSFEDMISAEGVRFAATGPGTNEYIDALIMIDVFGVDGEIITGFEGGGEAFQSVLAGDTDLQSRSYGSMISAVLEGDATPIILVGSERQDDIPDTPTFLETDQDVPTDLLEEHASLTETGRMIAGPPGMDPDKLAELRAAWETLGTDDAFLSAAEEAGRPITFLSGEETQTLIEDVMNASPDYVDLITRAYG
jgi:tripartite-type tricarboxylate transporter receptor subunit TctC